MLFPFLFPHAGPAHCDSITLSFGATPETARGVWRRRARNAIRRLLSKPDARASLAFIAAADVDARESRSAARRPIDPAPLLKTAPFFLAAAAQKMPPPDKRPTRRSTPIFQSRRRDFLSLFISKKKTWRELKAHASKVALKEIALIGSFGVRAFSLDTWHLI